MGSIEELSKQAQAQLANILPKQRTKNIEKSLDKLKGCSYPIESNAVSTIRRELLSSHQYPKLSLDFLADNPANFSLLFTKKFEYKVSLRPARLMVFPLAEKGVMVLASHRGTCHLSRKRTAAPDEIKLCPLPRRGCNEQLETRLKKISKYLISSFQFTFELETKDGSSRNVFEEYQFIPIFPHILFPDFIKTSIETAKTIFGDEIFIIAEPAKEWWWEQSPGVIAAGDPVIIGFQGDDAYLIDAFDCTPAEQYLIDEFS